MCGECDPRIHFALNCGAKSCPPIAVYSTESAERLEKQLEMATLSFISSPTNVKVNVEKETLELSQLFKWYASDFNYDVVGWLKKQRKDPEFLGSLEGLSAKGKSLRLKYVPYEWSLNSM